MDPHGNQTNGIRKLQLNTRPQGHLLYSPRCVNTVFFISQSVLCHWLFCTYYVTTDITGSWLTHLFILSIQHDILQIIGTQCVWRQKNKRKGRTRKRKERKEERREDRKLKRKVGKEKRREKGKFRLVLNFITDVNDCRQILFLKSSRKEYHIIFPNNIFQRVAIIWTEMLWRP